MTSSAFSRWTRGREVSSRGNRKNEDSECAEPQWAVGACRGKPTRAEGRARPREAMMLGSVGRGRGRGRMCTWAGVENGLEGDGKRQIARGQGQWP